MLEKTGSPAIELANQIVALLNPERVERGQAQTALAIVTAMLPALELPLVLERQAAGSAK
jgi:hypothetical protein